jgi:rhamnulose-1-phosphate aldolase
VAVSRSVWLRTTLDEAFGLIDTAEKAAEILVKVISMGGMKHTIQKQELLDLAERFQVKPMREAIEIKSWWSEAGSIKTD